MRKRLQPPVSESTVSVIVAIAADIVIAAAKFVAAIHTGSSAMISEGIHSVIDTSDGFLLLFGRKRSKLGPDENHSFGHGSELYFWSFIVALLVFALGGGMSIYEGVIHLINPHPMTDPVWNYVVLAVAFVAESTSFYSAIKAYNKQKRSKSYWTSIRLNKDPTVFTILLEDSAALIGIVIATTAIFLTQLLKNPYLDGIASLLIGLVLTVVAFILARESKELLIGEAVTPRVHDSLLQTIHQDPEVDRIVDLRTLHLAPHDILLVMKVLFKKANRPLPSMIQDLESRIRENLPDIKLIFIEPEPS